MGCLSMRSLRLFFVSTFGLLVLPQISFAYPTVGVLLDTTWTVQITGGDPGVSGETQSITATATSQTSSSGGPTGFGLGAVTSPYTEFETMSDVRDATSNQGTAHIVGGNSNGQPARQLIQFGVTVVPLERSTHFPHWSSRRGAA